MLDDNRDGALDRAEWSGTAATFRVLDRNRDGRVTPRRVRELKGDQKMRLKMAITMLAAAAFAAADVVSADGDGRPPPGTRRPGQGARRSTATARTAAASRDAKFRAWDKDGNGSLSRGEYPGHPGNFRALDTDNDGALSFDGVPAPRGAAALPPAGDGTEFAAKDHDRRALPRPSSDAFEFDRRDHDRTASDPRTSIQPRAPRPATEFDGSTPTTTASSAATSTRRSFDALDTNRNGVQPDEYPRSPGAGVPGPPRPDSLVAFR